MLHTNCAHIAGHFVFETRLQNGHTAVQGLIHICGVSLSHNKYHYNDIPLELRDSRLMFFIDFCLRGYQLVRWMTRCGFAGPLIVKVAPPASLMVALAGLGFTYLGIGQIIASLLQLKLHLKHHCH